MFSCYFCSRIKEVTPRVMREATRMMLIRTSSDQPVPFPSQVSAPPQKTIHPQLCEVVGDCWSLSDKIKASFSKTVSPKIDPLSIWSRLGFCDLLYELEKNKHETLTLLWLFLSQPSPRPAILSAVVHNVKLAGKCMKLFMLWESLGLGGTHCAHLGPR